MKTFSTILKAHRKILRNIFVISDTEKMEDRMTLDVVIKARKSIRNYQRKDVPKELLHNILETALWAPSGMNRQDWDWRWFEVKHGIGCCKSSQNLISTFCIVCQ